MRLSTWTYGHEPEPSPATKCSPLSIRCTSSADHVELGWTPRMFGGRSTVTARPRPLTVHTACSARARLIGNTEALGPPRRLGRSIVSDTNGVDSSTTSRPLSAYAAIVDM